MPSANHGQGASVTPPHLLLRAVAVAARRPRRALGLLQPVLQLRVRGVQQRQLVLEPCAASAAALAAWRGLGACAKAPSKPNLAPQHQGGKHGTDLPPARVPA